MPSVWICLNHQDDKLRILWRDFLQRCIVYIKRTETCLQWTHQFWYKVTFNIHHLHASQKHMLCLKQIFDINVELFFVVAWLRVARICFRGCQTDIEFFSLYFWNYAGDRDDYALKCLSKCWGFGKYLEFNMCGLDVKKMVYCHGIIYRLENIFWAKDKFTATISPFYFSKLLSQQNILFVCLFVILVILVNTGSTGFAMA